MRWNAFLLLTVVSCTTLVHGAETKAKAKPEPEKPTESDLPLPLPTGAPGTAEVIDPLVKTPPGGFTPFVPILDASQSSAPDDLTGWQITRMPARENRDACAAFWSRVSSSKTQWTVVRDAESGSAKAVEAPVRAIPEANTPKFVISSKGAKEKMAPREITPDEVRKVSDGWLVAQRKDPILAWFSADGTRSRLISTEVIANLTAKGDRWFALCPGRRSIVELTRKGEEPWAMTDFQKLPGLPRAMTALPDGRLCIVTQDQLLACSLENKKLEVLLPHPGWAGLNPGSVLYDEKADRVFVGLRHFVARCAVEPGKRGSVLLRPAGG